MLLYTHSLDTKNKISTHRQKFLIFVKPRYLYIVIEKQCSKAIQVNSYYIMKKENKKWLQGVNGFGGCIVHLKIIFLKVFLEGLNESKTLKSGVSCSYIRSKSCRNNNDFIDLNIFIWYRVQNQHLEIQDPILIITVC